MPSPLVSIVVPSRGGASRLPVLLDALSRQELDQPWEVVVVLDGDIDNSRILVDQHKDKLPLRVVEFAENRGRSAALNAGFEHAQGDILVRCDDDLVPSGSYLRRHVAAHEGRTVGVVGLYRNVYPETPYVRVYGRHWDQQFRREAYATPPDQAWRYWAGNVSVTRRTWETVGRYDTAFRAYGFEDVDWGYRLSLAGVSVLLEPSLETEHRIAATTTATRAQRAFYSGAARRRFNEKHALPPVTELEPNLWNELVARAASHLDERRSTQVGRAVDRVTRILPPPLARKAVALAVEASSRAGGQHGITKGEI